ncbi:MULTISPECIES: L,D-transpeptidase family protein [unclassified Comamonas]|uniref:L,D-transpeptidase family protein n=1 Tax=Comamonas squillarum TaxID=2977320 RepID=A0ABY6A058_9BURK|nr:MULTISPECIES: L,D-transpeptidase family protein [unclassified Comamonas]UXC19643.1 L,D-transpeptidase family protein [Comamonas sp. PR12]
MPFCKQFWRSGVGAAVVAAAGAALAAGSPATPRAAAQAKTAAAAKARQPDAEERLVQIIALVQNQQLDQALKAAASLTADVPHFQAAQLVYADLLRFRSGQPGALTPAAVAQRAMVLPVKHIPLPQAGAAVPPTPAANAQGGQTLEQLQGLQDEIRRRMQGAQSLPAAGQVPAEFLSLSPSVRQVIAIDASQSRLYLLRHDQGQLQLVDSFYVSVGKLGVGKLEEGDQRTPEGIYFIGRQIAGQRLPEFYGKGALTLNYPNDWDKAMGRSGSGIWLHGAPPDQFARLPQASDGCVVLANPDLLALMRTVDKLTPVLIREKLQWVAPSDASHRQSTDAFTAVLQQWHQAWMQDDPQRALQLATPQWTASSEGQAWQTRMAALFKGRSVELQDISTYGWKDDKGEIRVANLKLKSREQAQPLSLRQYWRKVGKDWRLFSEDLQNQG